MNLFFWQKPKPPEPKTIAQIAEENNRAHREFLDAIGWQTLGSEPELVQVYTDRDGNNYYVSRNSWQGVSRDRLAALETATTAMEYRMSREALLLNQQTVMELFRKCQGGDLEAAANGYKLAWEMWQTMKDAPSESVLMEYAVHLIYTDLENPETLSPTMLQTKRDRAAKDPGLRAFFLDMALATVNNSLPTLKQDGPPISLEASEVEKARKREITRQRLENFKKPLAKKKK